MQLTISDSKVNLPDPVDEALQPVLWSRLERVPGWIPDGVNQEQFMIAAATAANAWWQQAKRRADAAGLTVDKNSLTKCVFNAAVVGLPIVDQLGYAHLVPMHVDKGKRSERIECQLWFGYKGYIELARSAGVVDVITPEIVWGDEPFERWNDEHGAHFKHVPSMDRPDKIDIKDIRAAYVVSKTPSGNTDFEMCAGSTLRSLARRGNVWRSNPVEMSKKSPIRRIAKRWPQTNRMAAAVRLDEQQEAGEVQTALATDVLPVTPTNATEAVPDWMPLLDERLNQASGTDECNEIRADFKTRLVESVDEQAAVDNVVDAFLTMIETDLASAE